MADEHAGDIDAKKASEAYERLLPRIEKVRSSDLVLTTFDLTRAVVVALQALPALEAVEGRAKEELPKFKWGLVRELPDIALAAWYADVAVKVASDEASVLGDVLPRAVQLKSELLAVADAAAKRGRVPEKAVEALHAGTGHIDLANDLVGLAGLFRAHWNALQGKADVTAEELDEAEQLGYTVLARLAARKSPVGDAKLSPIDIRRRAVSMFVSAYEECRRAGAWLFWHDPQGWESVMPSLYAGQGRGRRAPSAERAPEPKPDDAKPVG